MKKKGGAKCPGKCKIEKGAFSKKKNTNTIDQQFENL